MPPARQQQRDLELRRLKAALRENEKLMQAAAINYETLVAVKEDLSAAIKAHKELRSKKSVTP